MPWNVINMLYNLLCWQNLLKKTVLEPEEEQQWHVKNEDEKTVALLLNYAHSELIFKYSISLILFLLFGLKKNYQHHTS